MLTAIGLWPYQTPIVRKVQTVFFLGAYCFTLLFQVFLDPFLFTCVTLLRVIFFIKCWYIAMLTYALQFTTFLTATCNLEFIFKELSCIFIVIISITSYNSYYFNPKEVSTICNFIFMTEFFYPRISILASKEKFGSNNYLNDR